jgi:hypothetical protein
VDYPVHSITIDGAAVLTVEKLVVPAVASARIELHFGFFDNSLETVHVQTEVAADVAYCKAVVAVVVIVSAAVITELELLVVGVSVITHVVFLDDSFCVGGTGPGQVQAPSRIVVVKESCELKAGSGRPLDAQNGRGTGSH